MPSTINATPTSTGLVQSADASGVLALQTGGTTAVTIDGSQNVGIGTSSPAFKLDVNGRISYSVAIGEGADTTLSSAGTAIRHAVSSTWTSQEFYTAGAERMRIDSAGNVGIGTSSPAVKFVVSNAGAGGVEIIPSGTIQSYNRSTSAYQTLNFDAATLLFRPSGTERMRIDASGNLLVGSTSANGKLVVTGFANSVCSRFEGDPTGGLNMMQIVSTATTGNNRALVILQNGGEAGTITFSNTTVSYNTSSDYRLKENIAPMTGALGVVSQLKPVTYNWKVDGSAGQGFIAHELQAVVPDCVTGEKDAVDADGNIKPQGIDTSFLVATLTAAIQEQQALITQLQADVAALKVQP